MANPQAYFNTKNSAIQVGSYQVPANHLFTYEWGTGQLTIAGAKVNTVVGTVSNGAMNTHLSNGTVELAFSPNNSLGLISQNGGYMNGDTKNLSTGNVWGYEFKLKRAAQVFYGSTYQFTLPAEANVIVGGQGAVGASYRQRMHIVGLKASTYQQSQITGDFPTGWAQVFELAGTQSWFVDTGMGNEAIDTKATVSIKGNGIG